MASAEPTHPVHEQYIPLQPLTYTGAVPRPHPPCTDPTPDQQIKAALREKEELLKQKEAEHASRAAAAAAPTTTTPEAAAPPAGTNANANTTVQQLKDGASEALVSLRSLVAQLSLTVEKATTDVTVKAHSQARALDQQQGYDRFASYFGEDLVKGQGEVLLADYGCSAMHNGTKVDGHLFITRNYLCFAAEFNGYLTAAADAIKTAVKKDANSAAGVASEPKVVGIKQVIPLKNVATLVRSVTLPTVDNGAPYFLQQPADYVVATALQVYEKDEKKLYQFLNFDTLSAKAGSALSSVIKGTALDRAYNYLDHAWREAVKVPVDGVQYV